MLKVAYERRFLNPTTAGRIMEVDLRSNRTRTIFTGVRNNARFDEPHNPAFSPSGKTIVFDRTFSDEWGQITAADLYEIGRDGQGLRYVTGLEEEYETEADWGVRR